MPQFLSYYRACALALDDLLVATSTGATTTTVSVPHFVTTDANASTHLFDGRWMYVESGTGSGAQRRVRNGTYVPSTGTVGFDPSTTAPSSSTLIFTGLMPIIAPPAGADTDYRTLINRAHGMLIVPDRISVAITTSDTISLASYPWLDREERLLAVSEPGFVSGQRAVDASWRRWRLMLDGGVPSLELTVPFSTATGSLTLDVLRPGNTLVNGAETTVGLAAATDVALPSIEDTVKVFLPLALEALMARSVGAPNANWTKLYPAAVRAARQVRYFDRSQESPQAAAVPQQEAA